MDAFGDNFVENEVDPAADFLAREQNELAGLEDELQTSTTMPVVNGNGDEIGSSDLTADVAELELNGYTIENELSDMSANQTSIPEPVYKIPREEPEKIKKWREEQEKSLEEKDKLEDEKKDEWRLAAKKELDDWYKHHEESITKTRANNRNAEKQLVIEDDEKIEPGTEWKRIAKLCDFNKKSTHNTKDASRMRSIILQLQQSPRKVKAI